MDILSAVLISAGLTVSDQIISTRPASDGAPFSIVSDVMSPNLNADRVDGYHAVALLDRTNHTGFQAISSIIGLQAALDGKASITDLSGYVSKTVTTTISANHNFTGSLIMPGVSYSNTGDGSNVTRHFFPEGGNGAVATRANFRVWNGAGGYLGFVIDGNGTLTWKGANIPTLTDVMTHLATNIDYNLSPIHYRNMFSTTNTAYTSYFPAGGNGAANSYGIMRAWDAAAGAPRNLLIGGDGTFTWGGNNVITTPLLNTALTTKENSFSKGDIVAGTNISLSGTFSSRLVGAGNLTINTTLIDRFLSPTAEASHLDLITQGGVKAWTSTAANRPENFGTAFTFVGLSSTGNGAATGTLINQILAGTSGELYWRQSILDWNSFTPTYQIWTSKHFSTTNVTNGQTAFGWGNHAVAGYATTAALAGKENTFSKGDLVAGTGVTLSGTLSGRLVGSGNITITATAVGSGSWQDSLTVNNVASSMPIISRGAATSVQDYLQLKPTDYGAGKPYLALSKHFTANKWEWYTWDGASTSGDLNFALNLTRFDVNLVDENRTISAGTGLTGGGPLSANRTLSVSFGTGSGSVAEGNDSRINNGQTAFTSLSGKENAFSKGDIIAGTNVTLSGTLTGRLVGSGNITINASGGSGGGGTVTSVGLSVPTGFSVSNSPITSSGNISLSFLAGYELLNSTDKNTWNNYASQISGKLDNSAYIIINGVSGTLSTNPSFTVSGGISGGGTSNYLPLWTSGSAVGNSMIRQTTYTVLTAVVEGGLYVNGGGTSFYNRTESQKNAMSASVGDMIYQTNATEGLWMYKSTGWVFVG